MFARALLPILAITLAAVACGGSVDDDASTSPTSANAPAPSGSGSVTASPSASGEAVEYFHRGSANMAIDHQRKRFATHEHTAGSDAFFDSCGAVSGSPVTVGTRLVLGERMGYPSRAGGSIAVSELQITRLDTDGLVLHVTMQNGTEFDDTWKRGLGTQCDGDCVPEICGGI